MRRRIFHILAAISLLLCLATAGLWVRSEFRMDELVYASGGSAGTSQSRDEVGCTRGLFLYAHGFHQEPPTPVRLWWRLGWRVLSGAPRGNIASEFRGHGFYFLGFGYEAAGSTFNGRTGPVTWKVRALSVPLWFVMLLLALAPVRWLVLKRREIRNRPRHLCKSCGYDLRATPDAGGPLLERCPECGTEAHVSAPSG